MGMPQTRVKNALKVNRLLRIVFYLSIVFFVGAHADSNPTAENERSKPRKARDNNVIIPAVNNIWNQYTFGGEHISPRYHIL